MAQAVFPLLPKPTDVLRILPKRPASDASPRCVEAEPCRGSRNGHKPSSVPAPHGSRLCFGGHAGGQGVHVADASAPLPRTPASTIRDSATEERRKKIQTLQAEIARIERSHAVSFSSSPAGRDWQGPALAGVRRAGAMEVRSGNRQVWLSGDETADRLLGADGLACDGLHEIKPQQGQPQTALAASIAAALAFAFRLAAQRPFGGGRLAEDAVEGGAAEVCHPALPPPILFCASLDIIAEIGRPYGPGLKALGLDPRRLLIVETAKMDDTLWVLEEGLKSRALLAVVGCLREVGLTPARRLSLAAKSANTPCLAVTGGDMANAGATASRWRVGLRPGKDSGFDAAALGASTLAVRLEKLRRVSGDALSSVLFGELGDEV